MYETFHQSPASERRKKQSWHHNVPKPTTSPEKTDRDVNFAEAGQGVSTTSKHKNQKASDEEPCRFQWSYQVSYVRDDSV
jgi:hypothetical protein